MNTPEKNFNVDLKFTEKQKEAFAAYWENGKSSDNAHLTKDQFALIPDSIENIPLSNQNKFSLATDILEIKNAGISYNLNDKGFIEKTSLDSEAQPTTELLKIKDVSFTDKEASNTLNILSTRDFIGLPNEQKKEYVKNLQDAYDKSVNSSETNGNRTSSIDSLKKGIENVELGTAALASEFHANNNYPGKIPNVEAGGLNNPLVKAFKESSGLDLTPKSLATVNSMLESTMNKDKGVTY